MSVAHMDGIEYLGEIVINKIGKPMAGGLSLYGVVFGRF